MDPREQVAGGLPPPQPPGVRLLPAALEEPARAWGITQGMCGLEEEAGRWF